MTMRLGELLVAAKLVTLSNVEAALKHQLSRGGSLPENLVELGFVDHPTIRAFLKRVPAAPTTIEGTGLPESALLDLLLKLIYANHLESIMDLAEAMKLSHHLTNQLMLALERRHLIVSAGAIAHPDRAPIHYKLTEEGHRLAVAALEQSQYVGPAPVTLQSFTERAILQRISNETVTADEIQNAFKDIIVSDSFVDRLGPALNSGRAMLLYGPPGNGKTSVALRCRHMFDDVIFIPYAVIVDGNIVTVYDPTLHETPGDIADHGDSQPSALRREQYDVRWVPCRRPFVLSGGELTLEMLDLRFNPTAKFYDAPLHMKALGGCYIIDDFGRQLVSPKELLNRWILPLEGRTDYLKLHTGKSFPIPFEEMIIFSTNLEPEDLMDAAFLRRLPYKLKVGEPSPEEFRKIFSAVAHAAKLDRADEACDVILEELTGVRKLKLAAYIPKFIVDQIVAASRFLKRQPAFERRLIDYALDNIKVQAS